MLLAALPGAANTHWTLACQQTPPVYLAATKARSTVVLIIDDLGNQLRNGMAMVHLPGKVNLAILPHTPHAKRLATAGQAAGKEIMLHAPMSNLQNMPLGSGALTPSLSREEFDLRLEQDLASIPHVRGVNNHMGSELTQRPLQMGWLMQALRRRGLYFVDSRTSAETVAASTASAYGVPNLSRTVFLDNQRTRDAIDERFKHLLARAQESGLAVGIGHPYPVTSAYLREVLPALKCRGIELALVSEIVQDSALENDALKRPTDSAAKNVLATHYNAVLGHVGLGLGYAVLTEVEDTGGKHSVGAANGDSLDQVIEISHTP